MTRLLWALGLAFVLLLSPAAGLGLPLAPAHVGAPVPASETPLQAAQASLAKGEGPANGQALTCTGTAALTVGCSAGPAVPHAPSSAIGWQKLCSYNSCPPPGRGGAGMTYDPLTGYVVLFGGIKNLTTASGTTYNDTWIFQNGNWTPLHIPGPTPRLGGGLRRRHRGADVGGGQRDHETRCGAQEQDEGQPKRPEKSGHP